MDKVQDESPKVEKRAISFLKEDGELKTAMDEEENQVDLQSVDWNQHPPVADIKIDRRYLKGGKISDKTKKCCHALSVLTVIIVITLFWLVMLLPQLCHFHAGICQLKESTTPSATKVLNSSNLTCSNNTYTGVCQQYFNTCSSNPLIHSNTSTVKETNLILLFNILNDDSLIRDSCYASVGTIRRFLCQYSYQPCDDLSHVIIPTKGECQHLRDVACVSEWQFLLQQSYGSLLPNCDQLPDSSTEPECTEMNKATNTITPTATSSASTVVSPTNTIPDSSGSGSPPSPPTHDCDLTYTQTTCQNQLTLCQGFPATINSYDLSVESSLSSLQSIISTQAGPSCSSSQDKVFELLCRVHFEPCDSNSHVVLPSRSDCENIRDNVCRNEWTFISNFPSFSNLLPNCTQLPVTPSAPTCNTPPVATTTPTPQPSPSSPPSSSFTLNSTFQCNEREGFYLYITNDNNSLYNNTCQARCDQWIMFESQSTSDVRDYLALVSCLLGLGAAFMVIFFSVIRYKRMFAFPSMFIVYQTIVLMIVAILILIQFTDRYGLSCSSDNLVATTLTTSTPFCDISGFVFFYALLSLTFWWFVHVCSTFWKVMCPFHARAQEKKTKYIHIILLITGIILPAIPPIAAEIKSDYFVHRYPPLLCFPTNSDIIYYGAVLPISLAICIGISFLIIILHVLHQKQRLFKHRSSLSYFLGLSPAEKKLLIIFFYYLLLGCLSIASFSISSALITSTADSIMITFQCEARPYDPEYVCPKDYLNLLSSDTLASVTYILIGLFPFFNLVFAVNIDELKSYARKCCKLSDSDEFRSRTMSTTAAMNGPDTPFTLRRKVSYAVTSTSSVAPLSTGDSRSEIYRQRTTTV